MTGEILCQIFSTMSTTLKKYSTPPAHALYSTEFFEQINLQYAASMDYPIIAPQGALHWVFDDTIPSDISSTSVTSGEVIPCIKDLLPICQQMSAAFDQGKRSVVMTLSFNGQMSSQICHFLKVVLQPSKLREKLTYSQK